MNFPPIPLRFETERLILTPEVDADAEWLTELLKARGAGQFTIEDSRERIAEMAEVMTATGVGALLATGRTRIWSTVRSWNAPSLRVLEKLGFRRDHSTTDADEELIWLTLEA